MPLPQRWNQKRKKKPPPAGFDYVEPVLEALEHELRDVVQEPANPKQRKTATLWPVHQLNWQKSRYIYDLYHVHKKISRPVYQYCIDQKYVDAALMAKWKKPGYERLCSTYVINPQNYKFGTVSLCRVPWKDRSDAQKGVHDPTTGCLGCASGESRNIFGNKYGQYLAAIQLAREARQAARKQQQKQEEEERLRDQQQEQEEEEEEAEKAKKQAQSATDSQNDNDDDADGEAPTDDDAETDDDDDDDFGPSPAAGIWAASQKLEQQSERLTHGGGGGDDEPPAPNDDDDEEPLPKKARRKKETNHCQKKARTY